MPKRPFPTDLASPSQMEQQQQGEVCIQLKEVRTIWLNTTTEERYLLLEDLETGDILMPLVYMKNIFFANYSRKLSSLKYRSVNLPENHHLYKFVKLGLLHWQWAFESSTRIKSIVRSEIGESTPQGHLRLVLLPIIYNALAHHREMLNTPLFAALHRAMRSSCYWPLLIHPTPQNQPFMHHNMLNAQPLMLFVGPHDIDKTALKYMFVFKDLNELESVRKGRISTVAGKYNYLLADAIFRKSTEGVDKLVLPHGMPGAGLPGMMMHDILTGSSGVEAIYTTAATTITNTSDQMNRNMALAMQVAGGSTSGMNTADTAGVSVKHEQVGDASMSTISGAELAAVAMDKGGNAIEGDVARSNSDGGTAAKISINADAPGDGCSGKNEAVVLERDEDIDRTAGIVNVTPAEDNSNVLAAGGNTTMHGTDEVTRRIDSTVPRKVSRASNPYIQLQQQGARPHQQLSSTMSMLHDKSTPARIKAMALLQHKAMTSMPAPPAPGNTQATPRNRKEETLTLLQLQYNKVSDEMNKIRKFLVQMYQFMTMVAQESSQPLDSLQDILTGHNSGTHGGMHHTQQQQQQPVNPPFPGSMGGVYAPESTTIYISPASSPLFPTGKTQQAFQYGSDAYQQPFPHQPTVPEIRRGSTVANTGNMPYDATIPSVPSSIAGGSTMHPPPQSQPLSDNLPMPSLPLNQPFFSGSQPSSWPHDILMSQDHFPPFTFSPTSDIGNSNNPAPIDITTSVAHASMQQNSVAEAAVDATTVHGGSNDGSNPRKLSGSDPLNALMPTQDDEQHIGSAHDKGESPSEIIDIVDGKV